MKTQAMPDKIGRYQILERVGRGGMGVLYRGHDPVLDREVAVKVMLADFSDDTEQMRPRFYREAKSAAKLQHRNIVTIFEFAEENNQPHIVMEFLRGSPLSSRMEENPPLTLDDKLDIVTQLCSGLGYAHKQGIVHRDVKPANVFILQDGTVKLLDFGIAKLATSTLTRQGDVVGSAPYMSPEQIAGAQDLDGRSDVWSTGVLLYELLTSRKPFDGEGLTTVIAGILREQPPAIEKYVPGLPQQLLDCVAKALEKDRDRRYRSAEELGRELQLIRKTHQLNAPPPMDETRFASTNVLKALHDDRQKQDSGAPVNKTLQGPPAMASQPPAASGSKTGMIAAGIAVALIGVAAGGYFMSQGRTAAPAETIQAPTNTPAQQQQPPALTPQTNAPSNAANTNAKPEEKLAVANPKPAEKVPAKKVTPPPAAATPPATAPAPPPAPARGTVAVVITGGYDFEVWDGSRKISEAARSHELPRQVNGRTLRLVAPDVFLDHAFKVDGSADNQFEYTAPGLGRIQLRAFNDACRAVIGKKDLGEGPWPKPIPMAAGVYQINLVCPDGQNPIQQTTVTQGIGSNVFIRRQ
jgi:serine/threonine protein kinase